MPVIRVELSAGRSQAQKKATALAITEAMVQHCGCAPASVHVVFVDVKNSDWAVAGRFLDEPKE
jgi:4-oxalocrotonate tautomerase